MSLLRATLSLAVLATLTLVSCGDPESTDVPSGPVSPGTTRAGTQDCPWLTDCAAACAQGDQACLNTCGEQASPAAISQYNALVECSNANACEVGACVQQHCDAQLAACVGATNSGTGGGTGGLVDGGTGGGAGGTTGLCLARRVGASMTMRSGSMEVVSTITEVNGDVITASSSSGGTILATAHSRQDCTQAWLLDTTDLLGSTTTYTPAQADFPSSFAVGTNETVTASTATTLAGGARCTGTSTRTFAVQAAESVTVPAGTFANAVKVQVTSEVTSTCPGGPSGGGNAVDLDWMVPGLGVVRSQTSDGTVMELVSYQ